MLKEIQNSAAFIKSRIDFRPEVGMILGSGLGALAREIDIRHELPFSEIPGFAVSTVEGHQGKLIFALCGGKKIVLMQGRLHYYEGYTMQQVVFPLRVMKMLGVERFYITNAAGGLNPDYKIGDLMVIRDHINFFPGNPLIGANIAELGPRFPDMTGAYDPALILAAQEIAKAHQLKIHTGVYLGLSGPTFETPAENKMIRLLGADAVGMSTVPEVIAARHMNIPCFALSVITDTWIENQVTTISHEDVIREAAAAEPKMTLLLTKLVQSGYSGPR
jgi:purine-nucleoside phosphorylase